MKQNANVQDLQLELSDLLRVTRSAEESIDNVRPIVSKLVDTYGLADMVSVSKNGTPHVLHVAKISNELDKAKVALDKTRRIIEDFKGELNEN